MIHTFTVSANGFDLPLTVKSGQTFRWREVDGTWYGVDGDAWFACKLVDGTWHVRSNFPFERFGRLFRFDVDVPALLARIRTAEPRLAGCVAAFAGLRMLRLSDPCETLFCFLCTANNHLSRIGQMVSKLEAYGGPLADVDGVTLHRFPSAERIAAIPESELRAAGFGYRAKSIPLVGAEVCRRGDVWFDGIFSCDLEVAQIALKSLPSVGPKIADCVALYGFHFDQAVPMDTHLWHAAAGLYFPEFIGLAPTDARYRKVGDAIRERFGDDAGWAQLLMYFGRMMKLL